MRKFLDTFPNIKIQQLYTVYPDYNVFINELIELDKKVKEGVSVEVEEQYELLMNTLDAFLFRESSIEKFNNVYTNPIQQIDISLIPQQGVSLPLEEREEIEADLESEIKEMMKGVDSDVVEEIMQENEEEKQKIIGEEMPIRTREDFDEEDRFVGISWKYDTFKQTEFALALAMLKQGCKFYYTTYGSKHFSMFKLKGMGRIIIETSEERYSYDNLFQPSNKELKVFMLDDSGKSLQTIFNIFKDAWDMDEDSYSKLDDEFLFNTPYIYSAYQEGVLWKEAELLQQSRGIVERGRWLNEYFSLYVPLERICTLQLCKEVHQNTRGSEADAKEVIQRDLKENTFYIEGIGDVKHSDDILEKLQTQNLLDINYKPTPLAFGLISYNSDKIMPQFRPFMYYMNNLGENLKKSKETYYSSFNGQTVYHTKKDVKDIKFALAIPSTDRQLMGVENAIQADSFPVKWQQEEDFKNYHEYLTFASGGSLSIRKMHEAREQRKATQGKIMFRDLDRKELYVASTERPGINYCINGQDYRYICSMYGEDNIRILGTPDSPFSKPSLVFFMIVDAKNNLLAVLSALGSQAQPATKMVETRQGVWEEQDRQISPRIPIDMQEKILNQREEIQLDILASWITLSSRNYPKEIWDMQSAVEEVEKTAPVLTLEGKMIGEKEDIDTSNEEEIKTDEAEKREDIIIDFDNPEEPIVLVEDEKTIKLKELNEELLDLQDYIEEIGNDPDAEKEIEEIKQNIEALKQ